MESMSFLGFSWFTENKLVSWKGVYESREIHRTLSVDPLQETNISLPKACLKVVFLMFSFTKVGYVSSLEGTFSN